MLAAQACVQKYLKRIQKRAINTYFYSIHDFDTRSRQVLAAQACVWFETVEGLAIKAHPFFCKGYDLNLFVKG